MKKLEKVLLGLLLLLIVMQFTVESHRLDMALFVGLAALAFSYFFGGFYLFGFKGWFGRVTAIVFGVLMSIPILAFQTLIRLKSVTPWFKYILIILSVLTLVLAIYSFWSWRKKGKVNQPERLLLIRSLVIICIVGTLLINPVGSKVYRSVLKGINSNHPSLVSNLEMFDHKLAYETAIEEDDCEKAVIEAEGARNAGLAWLGKDRSAEQDAIEELAMIRGITEMADTSSNPLASALAGFGLNGGLHAMSGVYDIVYYSYSCRSDMRFAEGEYSEALADIREAKRALMVVNRTSDYWKKEESLLAVKEARVLSNLGYNDSAAARVAFAMTNYVEVADSFDIDFGWFLGEAGDVLGQIQLYTEANEVHVTAINGLKKFDSPESRSQLLKNVSSLVRNYIFTDSLNQAHGMIDFALNYVDNSKSIACEFSLLRGFVYGGEGKYKKAKEEFTEGINCFERINGPKSYNVSQGKLARSHVDIVLAEWGLAKDDIDQGEKILTEMFPNKPSKQAPFFRARGHLLRETGEYKGSINSYQNAIHSFQELGVFEGQWKPDIYAGLSEVYLTMAENQKALKYAQEGITLVDLSLPASASMSNTLGNACVAIGEYQIADSLFESVIRINADYEHFQDISNVVALNGRGIVAMQQYKYQDAEMYLKEALGMSIALFGKAHPRSIECTLSLAQLNSAQRNESATRELLEGLKKVIFETLPSDHDLVADMYFQLGKLNQSMLKKDLAKENFTRALNIYTDKFSKDHPKYRATLRLLQSDS